MPYYSNISKEMTLQVAVDIDDTVLNVDDASGLPTNYPYYVVLDPYTSSVEIVSVTNKIGNALTVFRGQQDTAGQNHSVGAKLWHGATAEDFTNAYTHRVASTDVHGLGGGSAVVGTDQPQTLTLKTMSGLDNFFSNLPASAVTGSFNNLAVGQSNAASPAIAITPNVAASASVLTLGTTVRADSKGLLEAANETTSGFAQRWYSTGFAGVIASVNSTGRVTCVGVTTTGSITATGQAITCGTITASGLITANAGVTVPTGQSMTGNTGSTIASNGTLSVNGTTNFNSASVVSVNASATWNFNNNFTTGASAIPVFNGGITLNGTISVNGIATYAGTSNFNGPLGRDGNGARFLVEFGSSPLSSNQVSAGGAGTQTDLSGCNWSFTVPAGRTAVVVVRANVQFSGSLLAAAQGIACQLDGVNQGRIPRASVQTTGTPHPLAGAWTFTAAAGAHTVKLQYLNVTGTGTITYDAGGTSMEYQLFY